MNFDSVKNLPMLWYDAAKNNANTDSRLKLYNDTQKVVSLLKTRNGQEQKQELCNAILQGFEALDSSKSEALSRWIAHNTSFPRLRYGEVFSGAYPVIHELFETIGLINGQFIDPAYIDDSSLHFIESLNQGMPESDKIIGSVHFSQLSSRDLLAMYKTSKESRSFIVPVLAERLNNGSLKLIQLGIFTVTKAVEFFGETCANIHTLDLTRINLINKDIDRISNSFPNLKHLFFYNPKITHHSFCFFSKMRQLESFELTSCWDIYDMNFLENLTELRNLNLQSCTQVAHFNFLKKLTKLETLTLSWTPFSDTSLLQGLKSLKKLDLASCREITDISFLQGMNNLTSLDLSCCEKITDISFLKDLQCLEDLNLQGCKKLTDISILKDLKGLKEVKQWNQGQSYARRFERR